MIWLQWFPWVTTESRHQLTQMVMEMMSTELHVGTPWRAQMSPVHQKSGEGLFFCAPVELLEGSGAALEEGGGFILPTSPDFCLICI